MTSKFCLLALSCLLCSTISQSIVSEEPEYRLSVDSSLTDILTLNSIEDFKVQGESATVFVSGRELSVLRALNISFKIEEEAQPLKTKFPGGYLGLIFVVVVFVVEYS